MAMAASSALQPERCILPHAGPRRRLLRMLPPRAPHLLVLPHRRRGAVRPFSSRDGQGGGGPAGAVEKRTVVPEVAAEKNGGGDALAEEVEEEEVAVVDGALELRWPPWEGLPERYRLIGATSLAFVICNMDK